jgi:hypothetical protein
VGPGHHSWLGQIVCSVCSTWQVASDTHLTDRQDAPIHGVSSSVIHAGPWPCSSAFSCRRGTFRRPNLGLRRPAAATVCVASSCGANSHQEQQRADCGDFAWLQSSKARFSKMFPSANAQGNSYSSELRDPLTAHPMLAWRCADVMGIAFLATWRALQNHASLVLATRCIETYEAGRPCSLQRTALAVRSAPKTLFFLAA